MVVLGITNYGSSHRQKDLSPHDQEIDTRLHDVNFTIFDKLHSLCIA